MTPPSIRPTSARSFAHRCVGDGEAPIAIESRPIGGDAI